MGTKKRATKKRRPQQDAYTLSDLEQIKVLANPLRVRILEAFGQERTTKQVADLLGEKPTKLYHHVDALERVGLIALSRTQQNRGTVEKYYLAVARTFRAAARVFHTEEKGARRKNAALRGMIATFFDTTSDELTAIIEKSERATDATKAIEEEGIVSFLEIRGTKEELKTIRAKLNALVASLTAAAERDSKSAGDARPGRYRLTLAFYPLESAKSDER